MLPHAEPPEPRWKRRFMVLFALAVLLPASLALWLVGRFGSDVPVDYVDPVEHFKYGSTGGEHEMGFPYWIWRALPEVCGHYLPGHLKFSKYHFEQSPKMFLCCPTLLLRCRCTPQLKCQFVVLLILVLGR